MVSARSAQSYGKNLWSQTARKCGIMIEFTKTPSIGDETDSASIITKEGILINCCLLTKVRCNRLPEQKRLQPERLISAVQAKHDDKLLIGPELLRVPSGWPRSKLRMEQIHSLQLLTLELNRR